MGRPPGARNHVPRELKAALIEAATLAGGEGGLVGYLTSMAIEHPVPFLALLGRCLGLQVAVAGDGAIHSVTLSIGWQEAEPASP